MNNCSFSVLNTDVFGKVSVWWQPQASWPVCDRYPWEQGPAPTFPCTPRPWLRSLASFRCWGCLRCKSFQIEHQNRILLDSELVCKMWVKLWCNWKCPNQAASLLLTLWPYHPHMGKWDLADHINWALKGEGAEGREDPSLQICHLLLPRLSSLPHPWSYWSIHRSLRMLCAKAQAYKPCADSSEGLPLLQLEISSMNWRKEERREEIKQEKKEGRNGGREGRREGWWEGGMERGEEGRKKVRKKWRKDERWELWQHSHLAHCGQTEEVEEKRMALDRGVSLLWPQSQTSIRKSELYVIWNVGIFRSLEVVGGDSLELPYPTVWPLATGDCWTHERQCNMLKWSYFGYIGLNKMHH